MGAMIEQAEREQQERGGSIRGRRIFPNSPIWNITRQTLPKHWNKKQFPYRNPKFPNRKYPSKSTDQLDWEENSLGFDDL
jgi:hypothetical protein